MLFSAPGSSYYNEPKLNGSGRYEKLASFQPKCLTFTSQSTSVVSTWNQNASLAHICLPILEHCNSSDRTRKTQKPVSKISNFVCSTTIAIKTSSDDINRITLNDKEKGASSTLSSQGKAFFISIFFHFSYCYKSCIFFLPTDLTTSVQVEVASL